MKKKYYLFTLGCQMNVSDSQRIASQLERAGYQPTNEKEANLIIINACSVRQKAVDRIWGKIKKWQDLDKRNIYLTGCVLPIDKEKFFARGIKFFSINDLKKLKSILTRHYRTAKYRSGKLGYLKIKTKKLNKDNLAYIPIMTGCDNFCSYCVVPFTRGREISRPKKDVLDDVKRALKEKYKEILLLGQNVNSYYTRPSANNRKIDNSDFIRLLMAIDNIPGKFRFNFISSNPGDMSDDLIKTLTKLKKWPRELHLPLQSGDDKILKKMNRKYTSTQYLALVSNLKSQIANLKISTDIIVGFPGESKKQFENTLGLCQKIKFSQAYIAQYSPRHGTAAAKLKDNVLPKEKKSRWQILNHLINKKR